MLYAERHRPHGVGLAGAVHRTWAVAEKNDWCYTYDKHEHCRRSQSWMFNIEGDFTFSGSSGTSPGIYQLVDQPGTVHVSFVKPIAAAINFVPRLSPD